MSPKPRMSGYAGKAAAKGAKKNRIGDEGLPWLIGKESVSPAYFIVAINLSYRALTLDIKFSPNTHLQRAKSINCQERV